MEKYKKLEKFIKDNDLSFKKGQRNTNLTVLCGYATHLEVKNKEIIINAIHNSNVDYEDIIEIQDEVKRLLSYAINNNYGAYWETPEAQRIYAF